MDDKGMSRSMKNIWLMIIIAISLFVLGVIIVFAFNLGSDANGLSKLGADFSIVNAQKINYEDINVTLKKTSYEENIENVQFIFYDFDDGVIKEYEYSLEEIEKDGLNEAFYIENTSRVKKVSVYSFKTSKGQSNYKFQDVYEIKFNGTIFSPIEDETGYSREKIINCTYASDCKDNNPCTVGSCSEGICSYPLIPECEFCASESECEDNNSCTTNSCTNRKCNYTLIKECEQCNSNLECEDNNPCTENNCLDKKCEYTNISECETCSLKSDCEDDNPCTENVCSKDKCIYLSIPGCVSCVQDSECGLGKVCVNRICVVSEQNPVNESN